VATGVAVSSFSARAAGKHTVRVAWRTASERDSAGFNVWRRTGKAARYTKVNRRLIVAKSPGSATGNRYAYLDRRVRAGATYSYRLQLVGLDGKARWVGRVSARASR
jgi:hypothetical protein